ncbi:hypothetical protein BDU57DRAFT_577156 [Ampelomyces quisqualis]|uniref:Uncharacterized protein n=1 Tax=Ampelomyces quisqualis TaxID=50730 RepID=A0A6A5QIN1_AMPQU|nr:hypothetical protein BDU57DRAFT_577156 [Ampelomyces quisqualis]
MRWARRRRADREAASGFALLRSTCTPCRFGRVRVHVPRPPTLFAQVDCVSHRLALRPSVLRRNHGAPFPSPREAGLSATLRWAGLPTAAANALLRERWAGFASQLAMLDRLDVAGRPVPACVRISSWPLRTSTPLVHHSDSPPLLCPPLLCPPLLSSSVRMLCVPGAAAGGGRGVSACCGHWPGTSSVRCFPTPSCQAHQLAGMVRYERWSRRREQLLSAAIVPWARSPSGQHGAGRWPRTSPSTAAHVQAPLAWFPSRGHRYATVPSTSASQMWKSPSSHQGP